MPDLREVFEMVKQQTEPDLDSWAEQERRLRRSQRKQKIGAFALVAALVVALLVFVVGPWGDDSPTSPATPAEDVDPSPDGGVVTPSFGFAQYDIGTGALTGTGIQGSSSAVDVSPDGAMIAYVDSPTGTGDIVHVANIDGSDVQEFGNTNLGGGANAPRWSPDGTKIVFQGKRGSQIGNLYVLDVTTGRVEQITDLEPITSGVWWMAPTFSADGQTVYFDKPRIAGLGLRSIGTSGRSLRPVVSRRSSDATRSWPTSPLPATRSPTSEPAAATMGSKPPMSTRHVPTGPTPGRSRMALRSSPPGGHPTDRRSPTRPTPMGSASSTSRPARIRASTRWGGRNGSMQTR
jgi:hypothetical protein